MKRLFKTYPLVPAVLASIVLGCSLSACTGGQERSSTTPVGYQVDELFTHDGCTVYRFHDAGSKRYFTNCRGSAQWDERSGKTTHHVEVLGVPQ